MHYIGHITYFAKSIEYAETGSFLSSAYAALGYGFTGNAALRIDVAGAHTGVGIEYPGHLSFSCSIIRGRNVDAGAYKIFLNEFCGISARYFFKIVNAVFTGVNGDASFSAAEGNIHDSAFVGHQSRQRHYFVEVYIDGEANASLAGGFMMRMLHPVSFDHFYLIAHFNGEVHTINGITLFNLLKYAGVPGGESRSFIKTFFYSAKETIFLF